MKISDVIQSLCAIAPPEYADEGDPTGLQLGSPDKQVRTAVLCITVDETAVELARRHRAQLILTHHPLVYRPLGSLANDRHPVPQVCALIRLGVAVFAVHTNLDVAPGGVNDALAARLHLRATQPLKLQRLTHLRKLVTFVPLDHLEVVRRAICAAGAGRIGAYTECTFRTRGTGTFFAGEGAHPSVGKPGRIEQVDEYRIEAVVPTAHLEQVVHALIQSHPYEEPAYDIYPIEMYKPNVGHGRIGTLPKTISARELIRSLDRSFGAGTLRVFGRMKQKITRVAVGAGSGDLLAPAVLEKQADAFITGEMRSHTAEAMAASGVLVATVGHLASEVPIILSLAKLLKKKLPGLRIVAAGSFSSSQR